MLRPSVLAHHLIEGGHCGKPCGGIAQQLGKVDGQGIERFLSLR